MSSPPDRASATPVQTLELKGTTLPVTAVMIGQADTAHLQLALAGKLGEAPGFFDGELAVLDLSRLPPDTAATVQLDRLVALLRQAGMIPVGVRGLPAPTPASAVTLGLAVLPAATAPRMRPQAAEASTEAQASVVAAARRSAASPETAPAWAAAAAEAEALAATAPPAAAAASAAAPSSTAGTAPSEATTAVVIDRPLRSGQRIYARGRDLVLLAGVSPGAEVIADGSIHCYGRLRGRALAGASGDAAASIFVQDFQAELVSVAGVWRTFEPADPQIRGGQPMRVSLRDDGASQAIAIEPIVAD